MEGICAYCNQTFIYDEDKPGPKQLYCPGHRQAAYRHRMKKKAGQIAHSAATDAIPTSKLAAAPHTYYRKLHKLIHDSCGYYICRTCGQSWIELDIIERDCPQGPIYTEQNKPDYLVDLRFLEEHNLRPQSKRDGFLDLGEWYTCLYDKRKAIPHHWKWKWKTRSASERRNGGAARGL